MPPRKHTPREGRSPRTKPAAGSSESPPSTPETPETPAPAGAAGRPRSKKATPSFNVAREPLESGRPGWVYRSSDAGAAPDAAPSLIAPVSSGLHRGSVADVMLMPFALALMVVLAPVGWFARSSTRITGKES
jgi:hypothetical protein